jgi:L,D-transpeptidase YcbB
LRWLLVASLLALAPVAAASDPVATPLQLLQQGQPAEALGWPGQADLQQALRSLYEARGNRPLWVDGDGMPTPQAWAMLAEFGRADDRGLYAGDYAADWPEDFLALRHDPVALAHFDLALSLQSMRLALHLHRGRVDPQQLRFELALAPKPLDLPALVEQLAGADEPSAVLTGLEPPFPPYRRLRAALMRYRELAALHEDVVLPELPTRVLEPGDAWTGAAPLATLLVQLGDLPADALDAFTPVLEGRYDGALVEGVERFQRRHGLQVDGRIGARSLAELRTPISQRILQIELALERWRWVPVDALPPIVVNIPEFRLRAIGPDARVALAMDVVVGAAFQRQTPIFVEYLRTVVFRPYWHVPLSIVRRDLVPRLERDPGYLARNGYELVGGDGGTLGSAGTLEALRSGRVGLRQRPGSGNALGQVKFLFPNSHSVYMHDTPATGLFARARRDLSSGCVRLQAPAALAEWVLRNEPGWTPERIRAAMEGPPDNVAVNLTTPIPVHLVYVTAVAPEGGDVHFFADIYGHDATLERALAARQRQAERRSGTEPSRAR